MSKSRTDLQKNEHNSVLKEFFQDQFGIVIIILGAIPLFLDFAGALKAPAFFSSFSKAINLVVPLISGAAVIIIYARKENIVREKRPNTSILGISLIVTGYVLFFILLFVGWKLNDEKQNYLAFKKDNYTFIIYLLFYIIPLLLKWIYDLSKKGYDYDYQNIIIRYFNNLENTDTNNKKKGNDISAKVYYRTQILIFLAFKNCYKVLLFVSNSIIVIIICTLLAWIFTKNPSYLGFTESKVGVVLEVDSLRVYYVFLYIFYSPLIIIGLTLSMTLIFVSYYEKRNFYENINSLSVEFYKHIENITKSVTDFENWNDEIRRSINTELINNFIDNAKEIENQNLFDINSNEYARQLFYWFAMKNKLRVFEENVAKLSVETYPNLYSSGIEIDKLYEFINKIPNKILKSFKAVSHNDFHFWKQRGQEYLEINRWQVLNGIAVKRVFLVDGAKDLGIGNKDISFETTLEVLLEQIQMGIITYIIEKKDITDIGFYKQNPIFDFGVYEGFAVSSFDKPVKIGGRGLRMEFDKVKINELSDYFDNIISKAENMSFVDRIREIFEETKENKGYNTEEGKFEDLILKYSKTYYENVCKEGLKEIKIDDVKVIDDKTRKEILIQSLYSLNVRLRVILCLHFIKIKYIMKEDSIFDKENYLGKMKEVHDKWLKNSFNEKYIKEEKEKLEKLENTNFRDLEKDYKNYLELLNSNNSESQEKDDIYKYYNFVKELESGLFNGSGKNQTERKKKYNKNTSGNTISDIQT